MASSVCVVFITAPAGAKARALAKGLLKVKLAACVNVVPAVRSYYWWQKRMESARESLLVVKTRSSLIKRLERWVVRNHPYTVPEVISLPVVKGHKPYLDWIAAETRK